ncbi:MAG TPA: DNRLRE domain-containing protein [Candidatus Eisenbacteria bacterium]
MRNPFRELHELMLKGRAGRFMMFGALLVVTDSAFYKRCGCDKETGEIMVGGPLIIAGRTYDYETGAGLPGVQLTFDGAVNDYSVTTGVDGAFSLSDVASGDYQVKTWLDDFDERTKDLTLTTSTTAFDIPLARIHHDALDIEDTWVSSDEPSSNYSTMPYFLIGRKSGPGSQDQAFLTIELPEGAPMDANIHMARMVGFAYSSLSTPMFDPDSPMMLCRVVDPFDPATLTWSNRPDVTDQALGSRLSIEGSDPWRMTFDVKPVLEAYRSTNPSTRSFGVMWVHESLALAKIASTECADAECHGALSGTVDWSGNPPDFP